MEQQLRAYIFVETAEFHDANDRVEVRIVNRGQTPATEVKGSYRLWITPRDGPDPNWSDEPVMEIGAMGPGGGFTRYFEKVVVGINAGENAEAVFADEQEVHCAGQIEYVDAFGAKRGLHFRLFLRRQGASFQQKLNFMGKGVSYT